jgi:cytochrome c556
LKSLLAVIAILVIIDPGGSPSLAKSRFVTHDAIEVVEQRQKAMSKMLETIEQVAPRLGAGLVPINPAHWSVIGKHLDGVRALLGDSQAMWPPQTNLGYGSITQAEPVVWSVPRAFKRQYDRASEIFPILSDAIARRDTVGARAGFCSLVAACGNCHAAFRIIESASLASEGRRWLGRYESCERLN